ncbi:hypothetical protein B0A49_09992 [Cryomyces minteri]|uniref:Uncharacterized protein n=1 Tax=Cryomyces minteri TaxID=331657 RepID=A0A4U0WPQ3_9PEZI|nr:hypothetical protein B0A49_09992 [Cryomyces minteri]
MAPKLEQVFTLRAFLSKEDLLAFGPIKGPQLVQGGSDWLLLDPTTNIAHLDIRTQARTAEGGYIYMHYPGILRMDDATQKALQWSPDAKTTRSEDHYFMTTPIYETSSEELKWIEQSLFIGHGHWHIPGDGTQAVEYEIYKVVSA